MFSGAFILHQKMMIWNANHELGVDYLRDCAGLAS